MAKGTNRDGISILGSFVHGLSQPHSVSRWPSLAQSALLPSFSSPLFIRPSFHLSQLALTKQQKSMRLARPIVGVAHAVRSCGFWY